MMLLTPTGFLTVTVMGSLLAFVLSVLLKNNRLLARNWTRYFTIIASIVMLRLLFPVEFGFEKSIYIMNVFPAIRAFFYVVLLDIRGINICIIHLLLTIWLGGAVVRLIRLLAESFQFKRVLCENEVLCVPEAVQAFEELGRRKKTRFRLLQTSLVTSPMLTGLIHPIIVLPARHLSKDEWTYILQHEITHHEHHDLWIKLFCEIMCAVYWWNPLMRTLRMQLSRALEIHNDSQVTRHMDEAKKIEYLECILKIAQTQPNLPRYSNALGLISFNYSTLKQRFNFVLHQKPAPSRPLTTFFVLACAMAVVALSFSFVLEPDYPDVKIEGCVSLTPENAFYVAEEDGTYSVYADGDFWDFATAAELERLPDLPIYNSVEEANLT